MRIERMLDSRVLLSVTLSISSAYTVPLCFKFLCFKVLPLVRRRHATAAALAFLQHHVARLAQRAVERLFGNRRDQRFQQPSQTCRHVAAKRKRFTLEINAAIFFLKAPISIQPPEIAVA